MLTKLLNIFKKFNDNTIKALLDEDRLTHARTDKLVNSIGKNIDDYIDWQCSNRESYIRDDYEYKYWLDIRYHEGLAVEAQVIVTKQDPNYTPTLRETFKLTDRASLLKAVSYWNELYVRTYPGFDLEEIVAFLDKTKREYIVHGGTWCSVSIELYTSFSLVVPLMTHRLELKPVENHMWKAEIFSNDERMDQYTTLLKWEKDLKEVYNTLTKLDLNSEIRNNHVVSTVSADLARQLKHDAAVSEAVKLSLDGYKKQLINKINNRTSSTKFTAYESVLNMYTFQVGSDALQKLKVFPTCIVFEDSEGRFGFRFDLSKFGIVVGEGYYTQERDILTVLETIEDICLKEHCL